MRFSIGAWRFNKLVMQEEYNEVDEAQDKFIMKGFTSSDIDNLDVAADDVSDILSNRVPWNKWVKMDDDDKARNVEKGLQLLTKSNAIKNLLRKNKEAVISYIVHSLSESIYEATYGSKFGHTDTELRDEADIKSDILDTWEGSDVAQADLESFLKMLYDDGNLDTMDDMGAMFSVLSRLAKEYSKHMRKL